MEISFESLPVGNGRGRFYKPKEFLLRGYDGRHVNSGTAEEVDVKNKLAAERILISNLYFCLGEKGQEEFHKRRQHFELGESRYPRVLDAMEGNSRRSETKFTN